MERLGTLVLALLLMVATLTTASDAADAAPGSRSTRFRDLCPDALPWTDQAPLRLPARRPRDASGVPMVIVDGERYYRPDALAINGMKRLDAFRDNGDVRQLQQALLQAERIRELSLARRGAAWVPFWFDYPPAGQRAPWFNAMAQGLVLSFYTRLWHVTGDPIHLAAARRVFRSFLREGTDRHPWVAYVDGRASSGWSTIPPGPPPTCSMRTSTPSSGSTSSGRRRDRRWRVGCSGMPSRRCDRTLRAIGALAA